MLKVKRKSNSLILAYYRFMHLDIVNFCFLNNITELGLHRDVLIMGQNYAKHFIGLRYHAFVKHNCFVSVISGVDYLYYPDQIFSPQEWKSISWISLITLSHFYLKWKSRYFMYNYIINDFIPKIYPHPNQNIC